MPNPSRVLIFVLALAAACSQDATEPSPPPAATRPAPTAVPGADTSSPAPRATVASPAAPATPLPGATPLEPDFTGTGCFPSEPELPIEVTVTPEVLGDGRVRIHIAITSTQRVVVEHRHGQEFDASVDRDGQEIWRWSTVAPFVDPYGYEFTYEPDETRRFSVVWDDDQPADTVHGFWIANVRTPEPPGRVICFDDAPIA